MDMCKAPADHALFLFRLGRNRTPYRTEHELRNMLFTPGYSRPSRPPTIPETLRGRHAVAVVVESSADAVSEPRPVVTGDQLRTRFVKYRGEARCSDDPAPDARQLS